MQFVTKVVNLSSRSGPRSDTCTILHGQICVEQLLADGMAAGHTDIVGNDISNLTPLANSEQTHISLGELHVPAIIIVTEVPPVLTCLFPSRWMSPVHFLHKSWLLWNEAHISGLSHTLKTPWVLQMI